MQDHMDFKMFTGKRVHLGVSGSVAGYKTLDLLRQLTRSGMSVGATLTSGAQRFVTGLSFEALGAAPVYTGMYDGSLDIFGHLEPAQNADALVVAPATANILAKIACGLADDMLSAQALAFEGPVILAPAMNPRMWQAEATQANWRTLKERGHVCIEPGAGLMACGEEGSGRFPEVELIALETMKAVTRQDMKGVKLVMTLGPTREPFDGVRFWSNPSSGRMGGALATAAWLRGADVTAICGPVDISLPAGVRRIDVKTAREMYEAAVDLWPSMDVGCLTAAVADFSPIPHGEGKMKKDSVGEEGLVVRFSTNHDILLNLGRNKKEGQKLVGFAAETGNLEAAIRGKLKRKNLDLIVGNRVNMPGSGFATATNEVVVLDRNGRMEAWPQLHKTEVAWRIWDLVSHL